LLVLAEAQAKQAQLIGQGEGQKAALIGEGEGKRISAIGNAEAQVLQLKINSYGDPKLYAVAIVADELRQSQQPLVPSQLINFGAAGDGQVSNMLGALLSILTSEKLGIKIKPEEET
jgi:regulator of protease activity HflC (stomatin/prohibitin superfamily)